MNTNHIRTVLAILSLTIFLSPAFANAALTVFVSIPPQQFFVDKIAGDLADSHILVMPGASPHTYEPTPKQMVALSKAKAYFAIGVEFEKAWLPRLKGANEDLHVINTHKRIHKIPMIVDDDHHEEHEGHAHEDNGHAHEGILDPHIWLSPANARIIAENICQGFIQLDPTNTNTYKNNLIDLLKEIDTLDNDLRDKFDALPKEKRLFMVFHPSWGYFAKEYDLTQIPIEAGGNEPSPRSLANIIKHGREHTISTIFVQPQFSQRSAEVIAAELGANVAPLDPLAQEWEQNLRLAAQAFLMSIQ